MLTDTIEPKNQALKILDQGRAKTYNEWIQNVFNMTQNNVVDKSITPNIHDLAVGHNIAAKDFDPYLTWLPGFTALILMI